MSAAVAPPLPDLDGAPAAEILGWALAEFSPRLDRSGPRPRRRWAGTGKTECGPQVA